MTATLPPLRHTAGPAPPPRGRVSGLGHLLVAVIYAIMLLAAPVIVRYAPAPSATPIATAVAPFAAHADCAAHGDACEPAGTR